MKYYKNKIDITKEFLFFYGHYQKNKNIVDQSCFSQWYPVFFKHDGINYPTAEHYMMYQKALLFKDNVIAFSILGTNSPAEAKRLGRLVKNYDEKIWQKERTKIVCNGNFLKFSQNPKLQEYLLSTGDKILVEASPYDRIWGIGMDVTNENKTNPEKWNGLNLLGFSLMEVRDEINKKSNG